MHRKKSDRSFCVKLHNHMRNHAIRKYLKNSDLKRKLLRKNESIYNQRCLLRKTFRYNHSIINLIIKSSYLHHLFTNTTHQFRQMLKNSASTYQSSFNNSRGYLINALAPAARNSLSGRKPHNAPTGNIPALTAVYMSTSVSPT